MNKIEVTCNTLTKDGARLKPGIYDVAVIGYSYSELLIKKGIAQVWEQSPRAHKDKRLKGKFKTLEGEVEVYPNFDDMTRIELIEFARKRGKKVSQAIRKNEILNVCKSNFKN